ncbi:MAG: hypothetical protein IJ661_06195 [Lachnospiraceae bacterium]|nr:hypothetical protein [Lachnospiraceae bacterium]
MSHFLYFHGLIILLFVVRYFTIGRINRNVQYAFWLVIPVYLIVENIVRFRSPAAMLGDYRIYMPQVFNKMGALVYYYAASAGALFVELLEVCGIRLTVRRISILLAIRYGISAFLFAAFILYNIVFAVKCICRRTYYRKDKETSMSIFLIDLPQTPFLLWNKVYVSPELTLDESLLRYAVWHEYCHFLHGDFLWKMLQLMLGIYYWYDPFVWVAVKLMHRDSEFACDEHVIMKLGEENRIPYGMALLALSKRKSEEMK